MPSKGQHSSQAEKNQRFFSQFDLNSTEFLDWMVTGVFYTALHLVDAYFATEGRHLTTHRSRQDAIAKHPVIQGVFEDYRELETTSRDARYNVRQFSTAEVNSLINDEFVSIRGLVLLNMP